MLLKKFLLFCFETKSYEVYVDYLIIFFAYYIINI